MKKKKLDCNIALLKLKPITGIGSIDIISKRHNSTKTPSFNFYKSISKFKEIE